MWSQPGLDDWHQPPSNGGSIPSVVNAGIGLTLKTDAQRAAYTPLLDEIVYATDTQAFYVGDGSTVGGVASDCGFSTQQLIRLGIIIPRHRRFLSGYRYAISSASTSNIPKQRNVGNSVVQGSGASGSSTQWNQVVGTKLAAASGLGAGSNWQPTAHGVGGSTVGTPVAFLADYQDAQPTPPVHPARSTLWATNPVVVNVMSLRNEADNPTWLSMADYSMLLRVALLQIKTHNADPFFTTEPPEINATTGAIKDGSTFQGYYTAALGVAADEGASVVDCWAYFSLLKSLGVDLTKLMAADGVHPNDAGHALIASLYVKCLLASQTDPAPQFTNRPVSEPRMRAVAVYVSALRTADNVGGTTSNGTTDASTAGTARQTQLTESPSKVYPFPDTGLVEFITPGAIRGFLVSYYTDSNNTGRPSVKMNAVAPTGAVTTGQRWDGYQSDGVTTIANISGPNSRQFDHYYSTSGQNASLVDGQPGKVDVVANGGQVAVLGVVFIVAGGPDNHSKWANSTESGTWSDSTFSDSEPARLSSTAGDYRIDTFYGTDYSTDFETGPGAGKYTVGIDGAAQGSAVDLYTASTGRSRVTLAKGLTLGWHTVKIQVDSTKNASSSGFAVKVGRGFAYTSQPDPSVGYIALAQGETLKLPEWWNDAIIVQTLSGSPTLQFTPGASSITLGGTGGAVVRLSR